MPGRQILQKRILMRGWTRLVTAALLILVFIGFASCRGGDGDDGSAHQPRPGEAEVALTDRRGEAESVLPRSKSVTANDERSGVPAGERIQFNRDIRPILSENCYACHGPDAEARKADLRLDRESGPFRERRDGSPAIVRGHPQDSPLYRRITSPLKSEMMPPPDSHKTLSQEERQTIFRWIEQGAEWQPHWAFIQPVKAPAPPVSWGRNDIDAFTFVAMRERGLEPNQEADRPTLARRLSLDLTGLPASPELVETFVEDPSPQAYEKLVDRLLASPAYGEHLARYWLDGARYADTHGLHLDNYREIWPYRDWVVRAFNENKPFDEFTVEQIAGDLLPGADLQQKLATGFNRSNPTTSEGGAIDEEYRAIYAKDRVETTATVFMGMTMGCAACHDHKFDPLSQKDFYQFSAFFNNLNGPIMDGNAYDTPPIVTMPKPMHQRAWPRVQEELRELGVALERVKEEKAGEYRDWVARPEEIEFSRELIDREIALEIRLSSPAAAGTSPEEADITSEPAHTLLRAEMGDEIDLAAAGFRFDPEDPFTLACELQLPREQGSKLPRIPILEQFDGDRGWRLSMANGDVTFPNRYQFTFELIHSRNQKRMLSVTTRSARINPRELSRPTVYVIYDGSGSIAGLNIVVGGNRQRFDYSQVVDDLQGSVSVNAALRLGSGRDGLIPPERAAEDEEFAAGILKAVRFYHRPIYPFEVATLSGLTNLSKQLMVPEERRRPRHQEQLEDYFFLVHVPEYRELKYREAAARMDYHHIYDQSTVSLVMEEKKDARPSARILARGQYDQPQEEVFADIPEVLGGLPESAPRNRLGLARWLVGPENPLTARVTVNRFWQHFFGRGIVETAEDFGTMGSTPTHPELLDWLAVTFQESGWDVKHLIRLMVTSATYRQSSKIQTEEYAIDSENRFLARGPRYRLDGEVLRDQALFVSGSLNDTLGGPPVRPYQPEGIWNAVAYSDSNTAYYEQDRGAALYRRSLYSFWKRSAPPPNLIVFDAPSRETCVVRRERTNTPLQALTLMNDPQFVEAARRLAERILDENEDGSTSEKIRRMYTYACGTPPPEKHQAILQLSYGDFLSSFDRNPGEARKLIRVGESVPASHLDPVELASLTLVANQIMNLDSFVTKY